MSGGPSRRLFTLPGRRRTPRNADDAEPPIARWRAARLAYLSEGLGRLSHDLRGILSPALLAAERLQAHPDPAVSRSAEVLVRAVDRAIGVLADNLGAMREGMPEVARAPVDLRAAIEAAARPDLPVANGVPAAAMVNADRARLAQAWTCLFAHARARGAAKASILAERSGHGWAIRLTHDGAALTGPDPFDASDSFDLAIARDLLRACGGDIKTTDGAVISITLR